jgi:hypothetical protein
VVAFHVLFIYFSTFSGQMYLCVETYTLTTAYVTTQQPSTSLWLLRTGASPNCNSKLWEDQKVNPVHWTTG